MIRTQQLRLGFGLSGHKVSAVRGDVWHIEVSSGTTRATSRQVGIHIEGETTTEMVYGIVDGWPSLPRANLPGETTSDFDWSVSVPVQSRVVAVSDSYSYYCVSYKDNAPCNPEIIKLPAEGVYALMQGSQIFIALGSVVVDGVVHNAPCQIAAQTKSVEITAAEPIVGMALEIK